MKLSFFVPGKAAPGGSKRAFVIPGTGRASIVDAAKGNKDWRARVAHFARLAYDGDPLTCPLDVSFRFQIARPKGHYRTGRNAAIVRDSAPKFPTSKPDTTKLIRAVEDACTGILWKDDAQIVEQIGRKVYDERPGVWVQVWTKEGA